MIHTAKYIPFSHIQITQKLSRCQESGGSGQNCQLNVDDGYGRYAGGMKEGERLFCAIASRLVSGGDEGELK